MDSRNSAKTKGILAIDYGKSKVGLALADGETKIAFAYGTLENGKDLFQKIIGIVGKEAVGKVIVGIPAYLNREKVEYDGEKFGKKLKELVPSIEVEYQNEMFTTKMAQDNLIEKGIKEIKRYDDQEAARIILQSWLDKK